MTFNLYLNLPLDPANTVRLARKMADPSTSSAPATINPAALRLKLATENGKMCVSA